MQNETEELLGPGEVAARVGYSLSGLRKLEQAGIIPAPARMVGSNRRVYRSADVAVIQERIEQRRANRLESSGVAA